MLIRTTDTNDKEMQILVDYIGAHALLPKHYDKLSHNQVREMGHILLNEHPDEITIKTIVMILAHLPSNMALEILNSYMVKANKHMKAFVKCAIDECRMWNE